MPSFETTIRKPLSSKSSHRLTSAPMETHPLSREYVNGEKGREVKRARLLVLLRWGGGRLATEMERLCRAEGEGNSDYGYFSWDTRPRSTPSPPRPREPLLLMDHISEFP